MSSTSTAGPAPTSLGGLLSQGSGKAQSSDSQSAGNFAAAVALASITFWIQLLGFLILKGYLPRIYQPRTYLVPEKERTDPPPRSIWRWIVPVLRTPGVELLHKSGLDAYFFIRYLWLLLKIFLPLALVILPVLLPLNAVGGRGPEFATGIFSNGSTWANVTGLNELAFGNVRPDQTNRYWAHLILALLVIGWSCWVFYDELVDYIRLRQAYLTSPQHRLRASATTVLVSGIPKDWCTAEALDGLYDVFPGGVRNIWINRNYDELNDKIQWRDKLALKLEAAETDLIRNCKKAQMKQEKEEAKKTGVSKRDEKSRRKTADQKALAMASLDGVSANDPHQVKHTLRDVLRQRPRKDSKNASPEREGRRRMNPLPLMGQGFGAVGKGIGAAGQGFSNVGKAVYGGFRGVGTKVDERLQTTHGFVAEDGVAGDHLQAIGGFEPFQEDTQPYAGEGESHRRSGDGASDRRSSRQVHDSAITDVDRRPSDAGSDEIYHEEDDKDATWRRYLKPKDRDTWRLPIFGWKWMPSLPLIGKKVDTIYYCRREVARLNVEIEEDQRHPERFPPMNSAFVQFNQQVAAHMACQSVTHHMPKEMAPRMVEISPNDVIWDNMSVTWWQTYMRFTIVITIIVGMIIGWAIPVAFTGTLSQVDTLSTEVSWLHWLGALPDTVKAIIQGVLPQILLSLLLLVLPWILRLLAKSQGVATGVAVELSVQNFYFFFLFVQVFLVVSISTTITTVITQIANSPESVPTILAENIPKAANYFFSYILLQALSTSAGALIQVMQLISWFILGPLLDSTAREKWRRQIDLPQTQWGTFFPVYTNLACIGFIYSIISPLILIFNIMTFGLFWIVYRYNSLYVTKFRSDTGGLLFPNAINQLFVGLYVMEGALIGLFFLVTAADPATGAVLDTVPCKAQAIIMIVVLLLTILYQILLNNAFAPLYRYLPITLEDDAAARDTAFARAQEENRKLLSGDEEKGEGSPSRPGTAGTNASANIPGTSGAIEGLEDLTPAERDYLVQRAFQHEALRAKRPVVWIPRDDLGVADDEVYRTQRASKHIWISDQYTALDGKGRVVYRRSPPDFSEVDLIEL